MKKLICLILCFVMCFSVIGCGDNSGEIPGDSNQPSEPDVPNKPEEPNKPNEPEETMYSYYPKFSRGDQLYYIKSSDMTVSEYTMIASLQGITAQTAGASIYIDARDTDSAQSYAVWRENLQEKYGLEFEYVSNPYSLLEKFSKSVNEAGYILYHENSINGATVSAGINRYLMVSEEIQEKVEALGFVLKQDYIKEYSEIAGSFDEVIFERYKAQINKKLLFHQAPNKRQLRDYAIATKSYIFYVYNPSEGSKEGDFCRKVYDYTDKDIPILGWAEDELKFIDINSEYGKITIASDWSDNLSFMSAFSADKIEQSKFEKKEILPQKGKHYAAIVMSDGDNVQWYQGGFINNPLYYANEYKGSFPMTYGINPSLADLAPTMMQKIYDEAASTDYFTCAVSGQGYINATEYSEVSTFAGRANDYMKKSALDYMTFLDEGTLQTIDASFWKEFARYDNIKGGMWMYGDKYVGGKGAIHWENDKPLIAFRDGLWEEDPRNVAMRVNSYKKDYTKIEGYSLINAHCWSTPFDLIKRFTDSLSSDVVLVTADQLFDMVQKYTPRENKVYLDDIGYEDADSFNYAKAPNQAYINQSDRVAAGSLNLYDFEARENFQFGVNIASGVQVGIFDKEGRNNSKALGFVSSSSFLGEQSYAMAKIKLPQGSGEKYLEFYVKGSGDIQYRIKGVSLLKTIETLQDSAPPPSVYQKVRIKVTDRNLSGYCLIIEQIGSGRLYIDDLTITLSA